MKCRSCAFENMKNSVVCARCGAKLVWSGPARKKDFVPGRGGNGPLRRLKFRCGLLWERFFGIDSSSSLAVLRRIPRDNMRRVAASVVPGAGQAMMGERMRAAGYFAGWATTVALTAALVWLEIPYSVYGVGVAALLHAHAAVDAMRPAEFCRGGNETRLVAVLLFAGVFVLYAVVAYWIFRDMTFVHLRGFARRNYGWW